MAKPPPRPNIGLPPNLPQPAGPRPPQLPQGLPQHVVPPPPPPPPPPPSIARKPAAFAPWRTPGPAAIWLVASGFSAAIGKYALGASPPPKGKFNFVQRFLEKFSENLIWGLPLMATFLVLMLLMNLDRLTKPVSSQAAFPPPPNTAMQARSGRAKSAGPVPAWVLVIVGALVFVAGNYVVYGWTQGMPKVELANDVDAAPARRDSNSLRSEPNAGSSRPASNPPKPTTQTKPQKSPTKPGVQADTDTRPPSPHMSAREERPASEPVKPLTKPTAKPGPVIPPLAVRTPAAGDAAVFDAVEQAIRDRSTTDAAVQGHGHREYRDVPANGAVLIGLDVILGKFGDDKILRAVRPLFWSRDGVREGSWHGRLEGEPIRLEAKPGYIVGAIKGRCGLAMVGVQLIFMRTVDGRIDREDRYESEYVGGEGGGEFDPFAGDGSPIVGLVGKEAVEPEDDFCGLGAVIGPRLRKPPPPPTQRSAPNPGELALLKRVEAAVKQKRTVDTEQHASGRDKYRDVPESGAVLVGLDIGLAKFIDSDIIGSIRPLYWSRDGVKEGAWHGYDDRPFIRLEAKPGYVVGGLKINAGLGVDSLQVVFMRVADGRLNPRDQYESRRVGGSGGGEDPPLAGDGSIVVGLHGQCSKDRDDGVSGIGLVVVPVK